MKKLTKRMTAPESYEHSCSICERTPSYRSPFGENLCREHYDKEKAYWKAFDRDYLFCITKVSQLLDDLTPKPEGNAASAVRSAISTLFVVAKDRNLKGELLDAVFAALDDDDDTRRRIRIFLEEWDGVRESIRLDEEFNECGADN
jgi:hypothetical protein